MNATLKMVLGGIKEYLTDLQYFFHKDFIKENYYKHFFLSVLISFAGILFAHKYMHLDETPLWFHMFLGGLMLYGINFTREGKMGIKYNARYSRTDVNMGSYGGIIGALLVNLIIK